MNSTVIYDLIRDAVNAGVERAINSGELPALGNVTVEVVRPRNSAHGAYATGVAMQLTRNVGKPPVEVAQIIADAIDAPEIISQATVAPPGFINMDVVPHWLQQNLVRIENEGAKYGNGNFGSGKRAQIEFVSVNPTGPLHVGHARGAVIGSIVANLLAKIGYEVEREYYVNDAGTQIKIFVDSVYSHYLSLVGVEQADDSKQEYAGPYMDKLARKVKDELHDQLRGISAEQAHTPIRDLVLKQVLADIRGTLDRLGVKIDKWFSEKSLIEAKEFESALDILEKGNYLVRRDDALWFRTTEFGEMDDDVVIRSGGGGHTYFGTDIAYHYGKISPERRGFDLAVNIWGGDHHGHIPRLKAAMQAMGCDPEKLVFLVAQIVNFESAEGIFKLSKRAGNIITIDDLIDEVGRDACRYVFLNRSHNAQMTFNIDKVKERSSANPVFYVQYAHARMSAILEKARDEQVGFGDGDLALLEHACELALMRRLAEFPSMLEDAAAKIEPHRIAYYAYELARELQRFYEECRVISKHKEDAPVTKARLRLVNAARVVLRETLTLMGMSAPDKM